MADVQVWDNKIHLFLGEVVYAHHYVYADPTKVDSDLNHAFKYQIVVRAGGVHLWDTGKVPLQNGALVAKPDAAVPQEIHLPTLEGEIDDWNALDSQGKPTGSDSSTAVAMAFLVSSKADVSLPISLLATALAAMGPVGVAGRAILLGSSLFSKKLRLTLGHSNVTIPLQRNPARKVVQINHVDITQPVTA